jgi:hypothetical protein
MFWRGALWHCKIRSLPSQDHGFSISELYPIKAWRGYNSTLELSIWDGNVPAALLFDSSGHQFALLLAYDRRLRRVYADVVRCQEGEHVDAVVQRCGATLKPQDRITFNFSEDKVLSVTIRKSPWYHSVDMSIQESPRVSRPIMIPE